MVWFDENAKIALVLALVVWMGLCYLKAYARVKRGDLVVYAGWGDFFKSLSNGNLGPPGSRTQYFRGREWCFDGDGRTLCGGHRRRR